VTQSPEPTDLAVQLDRLIESAQSLQAGGSGEFPRLEALLAAAAAPDSGPQPGEPAVLDAYRELVAGTPSLAARRRRRQLALVALTSTVVALGGGVAAAATGSLPAAAQTTAQSVLGALGVHVPGPNGNAGDHPDQRGKSGDDHGQPTSVPSEGPEPSPSRPGHPTTPVGNPPTPGNSGTSRHHGNPTPTATTRPTPGHGKPATAPTTAHPHATPEHPSSPRVTHPIHPSITR
jgi:hypothetical protein